MMRSWSLRLLLLAFISCGAHAVARPPLNDALIDIIHEKNFTALEVMFTSSPVDPNLPDSKGRMPIVEAARFADLKFVDALVQFGARVTAEDAATGTTALHILCQNANTKGVAYLLAYGADPNLMDKSGKRPRQFAPTKEIHDFILLHDKEGAAGFEDPPGTWRHVETEKGHRLWHNLRTNETRWNVPPSCGWHRLDLTGQANKYVNTVTGQEVFHTPKALAWRLLTVDGELLWYNWIANITMEDQPEEVPDELADMVAKMMNKRWYNEVTGEFSWEDPLFQTPWRRLVDSDSKETYYFNLETGETDWETPTELAWTQEVDEETNMPFFFNTRSGESAWEKPIYSHLVWTEHDSDL